MFGIHYSELQQEYRNVYKAIREDGRLPATSDEQDEMFTLKPILRGRQTYEHVDKYNWYEGLVGLMQVGTFNGGALCFNQSRLRLKCYRSGAVVLFRGNLLKHSVETCKLAFAFYGTRATPLLLFQDKARGLYGRDANLASLIARGNRTGFDFITKENFRRIVRWARQPKDEIEPTAIFATADLAEPAHSKEQEGIDTAISAGDATSMGKKRRPQIEKDDDISDLARPWGNTVVNVGQISGGIIEID